MSATILVVEDEPAIQTLVAACLQNAGHQVVRADTAEDAIRRVNEILPDVVLLDWMLPGMSGIQLARRLRGDERTHDLPIIMLTARGEEHDKIAGLDAGADDYLTKPFSPAELLARIRVQLRRTAANQEPAPQPLTVGPVTIDPAAREALLADRSRLPLTKTEFDLLYYLAAKGRAVASHAELLKEVLGYEPETETKSLVMHIANIRRKLDKACPHALTIRAVAGVGYKLVFGEAL